MELKELKQQSNLKVLFRGKSGTGKTRACVYVTLTLGREGYDVLYVDTEAEGSTTMVKWIEDGPFDEDDLETIEYEQANDYDEMFDLIGTENQREYDMIVADTLDHKHSYALRKLVGENDEKNEQRAKSDADWNEYLASYDLEKNMMEQINKPKCNIMAAIDPTSGKMDKPKGCQVNVHGFFNVVIDMMKDGDEWYSKTRNFVGWSDAIGKEIPDLPERIADEVLERC